MFAVDDFQYFEDNNFLMITFRGEKHATVFKSDVFQQTNVH